MAVCLCRAAVVAVVLDGTSWYIGTNIMQRCVFCVCTLGSGSGAGTLRRVAPRLL